MSTKHTPGPWAADDAGGEFFGIFDQFGGALAYLVETPDMQNPKRVTHLPCALDGRYDEEPEDMQEAIEDAVSEWHSGVGKPGVDNELHVYLGMTHDDHEGVRRHGLREKEVRWILRPPFETRRVAIQTGPQDRHAAGLDVRQYVQEGVEAGA